MQNALASGMARLVEVQLQPCRDGLVVVHWSLEETGRGGAEFPEAPATLAEALLLGPVGAIDVGVGNLLACTFTDFRVPAVRTPPGLPLPGPLLVRGGMLDEECHRTGVTVARLRSELSFLRGGMRSSTDAGTTSTGTASTTPAKKPRKTTGRRQQGSSRRLAAVWEKHALRRHHLAHVAVQEVLRALQRAGARALILGWNEGIKERLNLGRVQNGRFGKIPYDQIRTALRQGCARLGILYLEVEESYTSKTSFADSEMPEKQTRYAGRRVSRGLFRTASGVRVNADVNASLQILVKGLLEEGCQEALAALTPARRAEIVRSSLNPRSTQLRRGAPSRGYRLAA